jgi:hypothetical protein
MPERQIDAAASGSGDEEDPDRGIGNTARLLD